MIDEYNTTKVCADCDCRLHKVIKKKPEGLREVRGLRWCSSTNCRTFKDRDLNASLNILRCFLMKTQRPKSLYRNYGSPKVAVKSFMIYDANSTTTDKAI